MTQEVSDRLTLLGGQSNDQAPGPLLHPSSEQFLVAVELVLSNALDAQSDEIGTKTTGRSPVAGKGLSGESLVRQVPTGLRLRGDPARPGRLDGIVAGELVLLTFPDAVR